MNSTQDSSQNEDRSPPASFRSLSSIFEMSTEELMAKPLVNVIGVVTDCRPPFGTRAGDWKMEISLMDLSLEDQENGYVMKFNVFKPLKQMPPVPALAQPVMLRQVKVQLFGGAITLITNVATEITYFPPNKPKWPPSSAAHLPEPSFTTAVTNDRVRRKPIKQEIRTYIAMLQNTLREDSIPTKIDFEASTSMARNIKDKFSELKDVTSGKFYDILCQVVSIKHVRDGLVTVYVTDYTINESFYDNQKIDGDVVGADADDPFGYLSGKKLKPQRTNDGKEWPGPNGKMSLQLTAFDQQGDYFTKYVKPFEWVKIRNVQIKVSRHEMGSIEGVLRNDTRDRSRIQVQVLQIPQNGEDVDPKWKNAIRRMKEYEREHRYEKKYGDAAAKDNKRKAEEEPQSRPPNAKKRREEIRKAAAMKAKQDAERVQHKDVFADKKAPTIRLNELVTANRSSDPASKDPVNLSDILNFRPKLSLEDGSQIITPFTNSKYRAYVRVTNFFPHNIADFSVGKKFSLSDLLSDNESSDESEDDDPGRKNGMNGFVREGTWTWQWRFMIQVEDARQPQSVEESTTQPEQKPRMWLAVDNDGGQFLLNSDACDLRGDKQKEALHRIKEKLFILWGDLEERKSKFLASEAGRILQSRTFAPDTGSPPPSPTIPSTFHSSQIKDNGRPKIGEMPADSDEEDASMHFATQQALPTPPPPPSDPDSPRKLKKLRPKEAAKKLEEKVREIGEEAQNKPFEACIKEWGVKSEDAEGGYRRAWGLFDTTIKH